jgi:hypothetical protein
VSKDPSVPALTVGVDVVELKELEDLDERVTGSLTGGRHPENKRE